MRKFTVFLLLFTAQLTPGLGSLHGQSTPPVRNEGRALTYSIMLTDRLRVSIFQEPDLTTISRVDSKGNINLPLINEIRIAGLTLGEAQAKVETAYREQRFLRAPQVTINVEEYASREVSITGEVRSPGRFPLPVESTISLVELVTRAGGLTDLAKGQAVKVTRYLPDGTTKIFTEDVENRIKARPTRNSGTTQDDSLLLLPGDIVYVPVSIF